MTDWDADVERRLVGYGWPGNVRELANTIERAVLLCPGRTIRTEHLPERITRTAARGSDGPRPETLAEIEEKAIREVLATGCSLDEAAQTLGIAPSTLWRKRKKYGI